MSLFFSNTPGAAFVGFSDPQQWRALGVSVAVFSLLALGASRAFIEYEIMPKREGWRFLTFARALFVSSGRRADRSLRIAAWGSAFLVGVGAAIAICSLVGIWP